jgi:hypothetical protein
MAYKDGYERNRADLRSRPIRKEDAQRQAHRLLQGKPTYQECEAKTGVPWWFSGLCHYRESNYDFTLGNLLNGKKSAIGIIGALLTSVLSQVPASSGLGQVLTMITPAAGLSPYTMPIFLALTVWGVLGKMEKWTQGTTPSPQPPK